MSISTLAYRQEVLLIMRTQLEIHKFRKPGSILHQFAAPLTHTTSWRARPAAEQRCGRDMISAPQRFGRSITASAPRQPFENGRKPIGRNPRDLAYRLSSRLRPAHGPCHDPSRISCDHLAFDLVLDRANHHHDDPEDRPSFGLDLRLSAVDICASSTLENPWCPELREGMRETSVPRRARST